jgi:hypothetical protein
MSSLKRQLYEKSEVYRERYTIKDVCKKLEELQTQVTEHS